MRPAWTRRRPSREPSGLGPGGPGRRSAGLAALLVGTAVAYLWNLAGFRLRQLVLRGGGRGWLQELESLLLRFSRQLQLHHRRQTSCLSVADGVVGSNIRLQLVEHARARGPGRCGDRRSGLRDRPALVRSRIRTGRRSGHGDHAGGRPDVPVQQPRRAAGAAHDGRRLLRHEGDRERPYPLARSCWSGDRFRVPHQDGPGAPRGTWVRIGLSRRRAYLASSTDSGSCWPGSAPCCSQPVGGFSSSRSGRRDRGR